MRERDVVVVVIDVVVVEAVVWVSGKMFAFNDDYIIYA